MNLENCIYLSAIIALKAVSHAINSQVTVDHRTVFEMEAASTVRQKMVSCFTQNSKITKKIKTMHNYHLSKNT